MLIHMTLYENLHDTLFVTGNKVYYRNPDTLKTTTHLALIRTAWATRYLPTNTGFDMVESRECHIVADDSESEKGTIH